MRPLRCGLGLLLSFCFVSSGQEPTAGAEYRQALKQAEEMRAGGDLDGVVRALLPWVEKYPDRAEAQHGLGLAYFQRNDFAGAIRHLSIALKLEPARQQTVECLGMAYYFSNRSADALPLLRQAVAKNPYL